MPRHRPPPQRTGAAKADKPGPFLLLALLVATVMFSGTGCDRWNKAGAQDSAAETVPVARRQFASTVSAVGAIKPQVGAEVKVGARISGRVERLHANIKDQVRKGQVIAELEKADLGATVAERRAEARLAEARLAALTELLPKDVAKAEADVTREIGLRRALGARRRDVQTQFLLEAALLAGTGGVLGILGGLAATFACAAFGMWDTVLSWPAAALGFTFSVVVGLIFGIYPAVRASHLEPIAALRSE